MAIEAGASGVERPARALRRILLFCFCALFLALFALWRLESPRVERMRMAVIDALHPAVESAARPLGFAAEMVADFQDFVRVYEQNAELRREIQRLAAWRAAARRLEQENARLRALNNVRLPPSLGFVTGEVIADSGGPFLATGLVNVGWRDGVDDGAAVMDGSGLVGRVVGRGRRAARVLYVTDHSSRVPVLIRPSGRRAMLSGDGRPAPRLDFLEDPEAVRPGDRIVTSGDGDVFPPDLEVGTVALGPDGLPRARLAADLERLEFVRVMRYRPETGIEREGGLVRHGPPPPDPDADDPDADDPRALDPHAADPDAPAADGAPPPPDGPAVEPTVEPTVEPRAEARP